VTVTVDVTGTLPAMDALYPGMVAVVLLGGDNPMLGAMFQLKVVFGTLDVKLVCGTAIPLQYVALLIGFATGMGMTDMV
jgi:hypothetical protein